MRCAVRRDYCQLSHSSPVSFPVYHGRQLQWTFSTGKNPHTYLLVVDYLSTFIETAHLNTENSSKVTRQLKILFARHGIPCKIVSDNGPQFASREFGKFAQLFRFSHKTSSPRYSQGNGKAERAVRTIKSRLKKEEDPFLIPLDQCPLIYYSPKCLIIPLLPPRRRP